MINGGLLRDAVISAAHSISNKKKSVDELNVFPVPDGDTGTNMSMTITNSVAELENLSDDTDCSVVASTTASALLRGARGCGESKRNAPLHKRSYYYNGGSLQTG